MIARPQAAVQQAPVQQPVAQETIQPQPPVGLHGLDALRHNPQPEPAQEQNPQYGNLNKPLDPSRLEQLIRHHLVVMRNKSRSNLVVKQ